MAGIGGDGRRPQYVRIVEGREGDGWRRTCQSELGTVGGGGAAHDEGRNRGWSAAAAAPV